MSDQNNTLPEGSKIFCPACNAKLDFSGQIIGSKLPCPGCQARLEVPGIEMTLQEGAPKKPEVKEPEAEAKESDAKETPEKKAPEAEAKEADVKEAPEKKETEAEAKKADVKETPDKKEAEAEAKEVDAKETPDKIEAKVVTSKKTVSKNLSANATPESLKIKCPHCDSSVDVTGKPAFQKTACTNCTEALIVPKRFKHFLLEEQISKGITSTVYRALDLTLNREVLIKIFSSEISSDKALVSKLVEAISKCASLTHANIVPVYTSDVHEDKYFIVSQFMNQQSLRNFVEKAGGKLPLNAVTKTMHETSKALLAYAESSGHHRNLTPDNILVNSDGQIKVSDFDIRFNLLGIHGDKWEEKIGSLYRPDYSSPSLARKGSDQDDKNDIYSLGAITYQVITGELPFKSRNFKDLVDEHMDSSPKSPKELENKTPQALSDLVMKMISLRPADRPDLAKVVAVFQKLRGNKAESTETPKKAAPKNKFLAKEENKPNKINISKPQTRSQSPQEGGSNGLIGALTFVAILLVGVLVYIATDKKDEKLSFIPEPKVEETKPAETQTETPTPTDTDDVVDTPDTATETPDDSVKDTDVNTPPADFNPAPPVTSGRPQPKDLIFEPRMATFKAYLAEQTSEQTRLIELERLRFLNRLRPYIIKSLSYGKYKGDILSREFDMAIPGFIFVENDKFKMGRNGSTISIEVQLENLRDEQFPRILEYLATSKINQSASMNTAAAAEIKESASMDYFRAALLAEWFGDLTNAARLAKEAANHSSTLADRYKIFFVH